MSTEAHCHHHQAGWKDAASVTIHCLTGCAIGEFAGLAIGVSIGLAVWPTMILATTLAFISGYALTLIPFLRRGVSFAVAWRTVWLGELVSISVMELVMNATDYSMGGMSAGSVATWAFWRGYIAALIGGYLAAWPINLWLLRRNLKNCH